MEGGDPLRRQVQLDSTRAILRIFPELCHEYALARFGDDAGLTVEALSNELLEAGGAFPKHEGGRPSYFADPGPKINTPQHVEIV